MEGTHVVTVDASGSEIGEVARRQVPVLSIPAGAVSIGGSQTGVSASDGPSGWNTIGTTTASFFDATRSPPALLQPGDRLRLRAVKVIR